MDNKNLSESEEILIAKFYDGECSLWDKYRVTRLISRKPEASTYLEELKSCASACKQNSDAEYTRQDVDIGLAVLSHIAQEERDQILLGKRHLPQERVFNKSRTSWALALSACAAMLIVLVPRFDDNAEKKELASNLSSDFRQGQVNALAPLAASANVKYVTNNTTNERRLRRIPRSRDRSAHDFDFFKDNSAVEVDWVRSDGRVRMLNSPGNKAGIIWVKRKSPTSIENLSDASADNGIRIIEKKVPWAMPAYK